MRGGNNKKGSSAIFLTMIFASVVSAALVFCYAARETGGAARLDAVSSLAGRSILSEFDLELKERYGLLGFDGKVEETEAKLFYYIDNASLRGEDRRIKATLAHHSLVNPDIFEEQIVDAAIFLNGNLPYTSNISQGQAMQEERFLRNQVIVNSLPSQALSQKGFELESMKDILSNITSLKEIIKDGSESAFINRYIFYYYNYKMKDTIAPAFFRNEVEYILYGGLSDEKNQNDFLRDFVALRTGLNLVHIYADGKKRAKTLALAESLTPGPEALITQAIIAAAWALEEAKNDKGLLLAGKNAALWKTPSTWATELEGGRPGSGYLHPLSDEGMNYKEYLELFLCFSDREAKLTRMMDLIQLNMQGLYYEGFHLRDYCGGLFYEVREGNKKYEYEQKY